MLRSKNPKVPTLNVMLEEWDYLIVLDACRYDFFSVVYTKFLDGNLKKICSVGSCTPEWCINTFTEYYSDVIYISANPYINSLCEISGFDTRRFFFRFNPRRHFFKIVDVWATHWDRELGTVLPESVNKVVLRYIDSFSSKRFVIHYLQPHEPYILHNMQREHRYAKPNPTEGRILRVEGNNSSSRKTDILVYIIGSLAEQFHIIPNRWKVREWLNMPPSSPMDAVRRSRGDRYLRKMYMANLLLVLSAVSDLCAHLDGKVVVTSDHGEFLGEGGKYGHWWSSDHPILLEVPYLNVNNVAKRKLRGIRKFLLRKKIEKLRPVLKR